MEARYQERLNAALWAGTAALFAAAAASGLVKACVPAADLQGRLGLFPGVTPAMLPIAGAVELGAALLLLLPAATRVLPGLSVFAAAFLGALSLMGAALPSAGALLGDAGNLALGALAGFVVWGRGLRLPLRPEWEGDPHLEAERRFRELGPRRDARSGRRVA